MSKNVIFLASFNRRPYAMFMDINREKKEQSVSINDKLLKYMLLAMIFFILIVICIGIIIFLFGFETGSWLPLIFLKLPYWFKGIYI